MNTKPTFYVFLIRRRFNQAGQSPTANRESEPNLRYDIAHYNRIMTWSRPRTDLSNLWIELVGELAVAYHSLGRARQAVSLTEESLEAREESLGVDHPSTIAARNNLASVYQSSGRIYEAIAVHEKTLAEAERSLGPDHPTTLASRQNLATAHRAAGGVNQAVPLYEEAVASREKLLGPEHPDTLAGRNMLASAYQASWIPNLRFAPL
jgi:tetratricopeptide (TPR) repeat protein